ncbi:multiheme c-type cytochrome [Deltaproteobacteria bacterium TL4]
MINIRIKRHLFGGNTGLGVVLALVVLIFLVPGGILLAEEVDNSCVDCHSNPDFVVTNKKLYNYFQEWKLSTHQQEGITCSDCHGGNPKLTDKNASHGDSVGESKKKNAVNFENIPATCGECHEDIYNGYRQSPHFKHLSKKNQEQQGPNCVTCHGSINVAALNVNTVQKTCVQCHNQKTGNHPDIPDKAHQLLNKFLSLHRFYRFISIRGEAKETREFLEKVDAQIESLSNNWHTFDLEIIELKTQSLLELLKAKRNEIKNRQSPPKAGK